MTKWIHGDRCAVRVEVEAVCPIGDPSEPCLEPDTVRLLDRVQEIADTGDLDALSEYGEVYIRRSA